MFYIHNIPEAAKVIEAKFNAVMSALTNNHFVITHSQNTPTYKKVIGTRTGLTIAAIFELNDTDIYTEHLYIDGAIHLSEIYYLASFASRIYESHTIGLNDIDHILANLEEIAGIMDIDY